MFEAQQQSGAHGYTVEGKLIRVAHTGPLTVADIEPMLGVYNEHIARHGVLQLLIDRTRAANFPSDVRRCLVDWMKSTGNGKRMVVAIFGGGPMDSVRTTLMMSAARLLTGYTPPARCFAEEAAARRWLAEQTI